MTTADARPAIELAPRQSRTDLAVVHSRTVRLTHWLNAVAMLIMIGSGWEIWNSSPIFDFSFPHSITIGSGELRLSQDLHNEDGLAGALQWHFTAMWVLSLNGLVYVVYGILSSHFRRLMFSVGPSAFVRDAIAAAQFRLPHRLGTYNAVQKTLYLGVLAVGAIMVLSGLAIWKPVQFHELAASFGGFDSARLVHFLGMCAIVTFVIVHLTLVIIVPRTLPPMITGWARVHEK
jgi:thiosulfate reductase cytochrome b subunit